MGSSFLSYERPLVHFLGPNFETASTYETRPGGEMDYRTKRLKKFVDANVGKSGMSVGLIVRELGLEISGSHAARLFKRDMGIGIRQYAKQIRLSAAASSLRKTTLSVKHIAADLGYTSVQDFGRAFKNAFRLSPTEYRSLQRPAA